MTTASYRVELRVRALTDDDDIFSSLVDVMLSELVLEVLLQADETKPAFPRPAAGT